MGEPLKLVFEEDGTYSLAYGKDFYCKMGSREDCYVNFLKYLGHTFEVDYRVGEFF